MDKKATDLMIDFETLDTRPTAAVTQLGWCLFCAEDESAGFLHRGYKIRPDTDARTVSWDTISWWLKQDAAAQAQMIAGRFRKPDEIIGELNLQIANNDIKRVWACGSDFDLPIIKNLADQYDMALNWKFWQHRCLRTLYELGGYEKKDRHKAEIPHVAEYDAVAQAKDVIAIYKKLGLAK